MDKLSKLSGACGTVVGMSWIDASHIAWSFRHFSGSATTSMVVISMRSSRIRSRDASVMAVIVARFATRSSSQLLLRRSSLYPWAMSASSSSSDPSTVLAMNTAAPSVIA